ncbi:unnamed protein product, partial [Callosobruchus maculatus]
MNDYQPQFMIDEFHVNFTGKLLYLLSAKMKMIDKNRYR